MAKTIDLRHLVQPEVDTILFTGSLDKKEYSVPAFAGVGAKLMLQQYIQDFNKTRDTQNFDASDSIELSYLTLTAWIKSYYPDINLEWTRLNISEELLGHLMEIANNLFFPKPKEAEKPKKNPKTKLKS